MPRARRAWSTIRSEVRRLLRETTAADSFWSDTDLLDYFNTAQDLRFMDLADSDEGWFTEPWVTNIVANQKEYTIPEGTDRVKRVVLIFTEGGRTLEIPLTRNERWSDPMVTQSGVATGAIGAMPTYRIVGEEVWLEPPPTEARTNGLRIELEAAPARISADGDKIDLKWPSIAETLLIYDTWDIAVGVEDAQDLVSGNPVALGRLSRTRAQLESKWNTFIERRSYGRSYSAPFYTGD